MIGTALRRTGAGLTSPPAFTNTVAAFWAGDPAWSNPGNGNAVSSWRDYSGQGRDITQSTPGFRPIYQASVAGLNSQPAVAFDITDDNLGSSAFTATGTTAHTLLMVLRLGSTVSGTQVFFAPPSGAFLSFYGYLGTWTGFTTATSGSPFSASGIAANTSYAVRLHIKSGTDKWSVNGTQSDNNGGDLVPNALTTVGLGGVGGASGAGASIAYAALIDADATADANWSTFVSWVSTTYGLTIA